MRTKFARMLKDVRASGGTIKKADMGGTYAVFGGEAIESGVWFRWNPEKLRSVDMLEEAVHWQQYKGGLQTAGYTPQAKRTAHLAKDIPATLDENACNARNGEVYVPVDSTSSVQQVVFNQIITQNWINSDFWIPSLFYHYDILIGEGWFRLNEELNQAVIINATVELEAPIRINAVNDLSIVCECMDIYSKEYYVYD